MVHRPLSVVLGLVLFVYGGLGQTGADEYFLLQGPRLMTTIPLEPLNFVQSYWVSYKSIDQDVIIHIYQTRSPFLRFLFTGKTLCKEQSIFFSDLPNQRRAWMISKKNQGDFVLIGKRDLNPCVFWSAFEKAREPLLSLDALTPTPRYPAFIKE